MVSKRYKARELLKLASICDIKIEIMIMAKQSVNYLKSIQVRIARNFLHGFGDNTAHSSKNMLIILIFCVEQGSC